MFSRLKSQRNLKLGHVGSKTRLLGKNLEKPFVSPRVYIFIPILMKLGQNVCLDEVSDEIEKGPCWVKKLGHWVKS